MHALIDRSALELETLVIERALDLYRAWRLSEESAATELVDELCAGAPFDLSILIAAEEAVLERIERRTSQKEAHVNLFFERVYLACAARRAR